VEEAYQAILSNASLQTVPAEVFYLSNLTYLDVTHNRTWHAFGFVSWSLSFDILC
jgi:hypothetical protein